MRELVLATIADQSDIEIAGEITDEEQIEAAVTGTQPDFLIVALESGNRLPGFCASVLQNHPNLRVIAIAPDRNCTVFYWAALSIQHTQIETSEAGVLSALRSGKQLIGS